MEDLLACPQCNFWPMSAKHKAGWSAKPPTFRCGKCGHEPGPVLLKKGAQGARKIAQAGLKLSRSSNPPQPEWPGGDEDR
jgi:hypothetical protein